ncbi:MAG: proton-conducting transporter membrane subunit, partial [Pseudomonadota bacterium]
MANETSNGSPEPVHQELAEAPATFTEVKNQNQGTAPNFVVGMGASAGGLRPIQNLVAALPRNSSCAFIIVQHLSPDFESVMDELLERCTDIPIRHIEDDLLVERDTIYLNPPRAVVTIENGRFQIRSEPAPRGQAPRVIDAFFASLADAYGKKSVAIVLSGTGNDGTQGAEQVRVARGLVMAQWPDSAEFEFMPRHVIDAGVAHKVETPEGLAVALKRWMRGERDIEIDQIESGHVEGILSLIETTYGIDFKDYKTDTINRRIRRRAALMPHLRFADYADMLQHNAQELERLYQDMLINVTGFFRNPDAFECLERVVIPKIIERATIGDTLRVWVPGCATGEEAFSIAMLFGEALSDQTKDLEYNVFATDIHRHSLQEASRGVYTAERLEGLTTERIDRHFQAESDGFRIDPELRRRVTFSHLNVLDDPPFMRMDLISCRNVLIYFEPDAQRHVLQRLHFGLNVRGYLLLGSSETVGSLSNELEIVNQRWNIYTKKRDTKVGRLYERAGLRRKGPTLSPGSNLVREISPENKLYVGYESLLSALLPMGILADEDGNPLHLFGDAGSLLQLSSGVFDRPVPERVQPHLRSAVNAAMQRARLHKEGSTVLSQPHPDTGIVTSCRVTPLTTHNVHGTYLLFVFADSSTTRDDQAIPISVGVADPVAERRIAELERDLQVTEESLQSTIEELQASNEELMASNEELQSSNEELHSVNEELHTLGQENRERIRELTALTNDMDNLLAAIDVPVVFVDDDLRIRRFTESATDLFHLTEHDQSRTLTAIRPRFDDRILVEELRSIRENGETQEREVRSESGKIYIMRLRSLHSKLPSITGTLITFFLFYELLTLATWPLVVHKGNAASIRAGRRYLTYTMLGSGVFFAAIIWLESIAGPVSFTDPPDLAGLDPWTLRIILALLVAGLGVKAALIGLHSWLPAAMVAPAPVSALLHAVAVVKAGAFGIVRVVYDVYGISLVDALAMTLPLALLASATILYGSIRALGQRELKRLLAYSTVSQVSYIMLGVVMFSPFATIGGLIHLVHQGLMKITLFFCAGIFDERAGVRAIRDLDGIGPRMPFTSVAFSVGALGMIGLPPIAGFVSKWYLGLGALDAGQPWVIAVLVSSSLLNAAYFLPVLYRI